jgi:hypothetical protein
LKPRFEATGIKLVCECGQHHFINPHGALHGKWKCGPCGRTITWGIVADVKMEGKKKEPDVMDIFNRR